MKSFAKELVQDIEELKTTHLNFLQDHTQTKTLHEIWTMAQLIHNLADSHTNAFNQKS